MLSPRPLPALAEVYRLRGDARGIWVAGGAVPDQEWFRRGDGAFDPVYRILSGSPTRCIHFTSFHFEPDRLGLTAVAVMTGPPEANDGLVPWERLAAGIPPLDLPRDLRHGIAHLSFLVATDESLRRGLGPHWRRGLGRVAPSTARRLAPTLRPIGPDPVATVPDGAMTVRLGGWAMGIRNGHLVQVGGDGPLDPVATRPGESIERCIDRLVAHHELPAAEHRLLTSWHLAAGGSGFVELTCLLLFAAVPDHVRAAKVPEIVSRGYTPPPHDPERPPVVTLYDTLRHGLREVAIQVDEGDLRLPPEWRGPLAAFWEPDPARHALAARRAVGIYGYEQGL